MEKLENRKISLVQATAINMIDMVGIGPFVVIPIIISYFNSPLFLWAWVLGAFIAIMDGMIWSELGAAYPLAGGSYNFLRVSYGEKWGPLMSFLFVWQTSIQAPLVVASGSIGFAQYFHYLLPLAPWQQKLLSVGVIAIVTAILYRKIDTIGKISVFLWICVLLTIFWVITGGILHHPVSYSPFPDRTHGFLNAAFWVALGQGSVKSIYSYLGYYNVCHLGSEISNPQKNIPRSIFISVIGIAVLYLCMNVSVAHVIPWQEAKQYKFIVSVFIEKCFGQSAARFATALVLGVAFSSLFAVLLGYSRVPYAAAVDGNFFAVFGRLHPTKNFPYVSLLFIAGMAVMFSLVLSLEKVISAILAMRILIQFISQAIGVVILRKRSGTRNLPFRMWLYPFPVVISIIVWLYIFVSTGWFALVGTFIAASGVLFFFARKAWQKKQAALR